MFEPVLVLRLQTGHGHRTGRVIASVAFSPDSAGCSLHQARLSGAGFFRAKANRCEEADQGRADDMGTIHVPILQIPFHGE